MDVTHDPSTDPRVFEEKSKEFFISNNTPAFTSAQEAIGMITAGDPLVDVYLRQLANEHATYSDELILQFGSALGEAYRQAFIGAWEFSPTQGRWVVSYMSPLGSKCEINIFHKLEKRFDNGMEDSIGYQFEMMRQMYLAEADQLPSRE